MSSPVVNYRQLKADALAQALVPQRRTPTEAVRAWRVHLLELLALHVRSGPEAPTPAELSQLQRQRKRRFVRGSPEDPAGGRLWSGGLPAGPKLARISHRSLCCDRRSADSRRSRDETPVTDAG